MTVLPLRVVSHEHALFGLAVSTARRQKGLTQVGLVKALEASDLRFTHYRVGRIERGEWRVTALEVVTLADVLSMGEDAQHFADYLDGRDDPKLPPGVEVEPAPPVEPAAVPAMEGWWIAVPSGGGQPTAHATELDALRYLAGERVTFVEIKKETA